MGGIGSGNETEVKRPRFHRGFTMIEVMIVVVIVAVLAALAAPSFLDATLSSRLGTLANKFVASAHLARSEAIKRNSEITVCVSTDGVNCAAGDWEQGWIVTCPTTDDVSCDPAGDPAVDPTIIFHREQASPTGFKIIEQSATPLEILSFQPTGVGATAATLKVCRLTPSVGSQERVVTISATGRPSVSTTETGDCT